MIDGGAPSCYGLTALFFDVLPSQRVVVSLQLWSIPSTLAAGRISYGIVVHEASGRASGFNKEYSKGGAQVV